MFVFMLRASWCPGMRGPLLLPVGLDFGSGRDALKEMSYATPPTYAGGNESDENQVMMAGGKL